MSEIKPVVEERVVVALLAEVFDQPVAGLQPLEGGLIAQTFSFSTGSDDFVIRFNTDKMDTGFEKEEYIWRNYGSSLVPIPSVIRVGRLKELVYCITCKADGQRLDRLLPAEIQRAIPSVIATLNAIHAVDVSDRQGYGLFDGQGRGFFPRWASCLEYVKDEERPNGFFGKWHGLFETSFLNRDVFDRVYEKMKHLLCYCPSDRYLVHGGYGFGNVLVAGDQVTAVLDWNDAKYGDFLYDVAWLDFYDPARSYPELFRASYVEYGADVPDFHKRLLCYQCYMALDSMRFFAKANNPQAYQWVVARISSLLAA